MEQQLNKQEVQLDDGRENQTQEAGNQSTKRALGNAIVRLFGNEKAAVGVSVLLTANVMRIFNQEYDEKMYSKYGQLHRTLASTYYRMSSCFKLRAVSDFLLGSRKVGHSTVWLLGVCYPETEEEGVEEMENGKKGKKAVFLSPEVFEELQADFESRIWVTYRRDFQPLGQHGFTTDVGWGCTLRSGQMMLAQALLSHFFGRQWRRGHSKQQDGAVQLLNWFRDEPDCPFSIHKFIEIGSKHGVVAGQWLGPYVVSRTLESMVNEQIGDYVHCHVLFDSGGGAPTLHGEKVSDFFDRKNISRSSMPKLPQRLKSCTRQSSTVLTKQGKGLILLVPLVLGVNCMNKQYHKQLLTLFTYPQSIGVLGGRPSSSLYFVGTQSDNLLYLDPHESQAVVRDGDMSSYHCDIIRQIPVTSMDSSLALGFYCSNKQEFEDLCGRLLELEMDSNGAPLITQTAVNQIQDQRHECFPDDNQLSSYVDEDEDDWEVVV
eukprot:TRINITY_DN2279_c0_g1_i5.p1 TRINITY_DN2279_c0_g1~~TRINITY_DN2279_c0_g1_i5.p1  ORF type:complete len:488 (-),score=33.64 TRINITY_DN2279_c0_g1_i5:594-2057(-)